MTDKFDADETKLISGEKKLSDQEIEGLKDWLKKRKEDYPLQYFIGNTLFMEHKFFVGDSVLIPRHETEEIGWFVVNESKEKAFKRVLDIGSGSGCLGIGVSLHLKGIEELGVIEPFGDDSLEKNVKSLCDDKSFSKKILKTDFESYEFDRKFDLILSNPPYIYFEDPDVASGVYEHEPHEALFGGEKGWEKVVSWVEKSYPHLNSGGLLVFEMSHDQRAVVETKLKKYSPKVYKDSFGKDRFFVVEKNED